MKNKVSIQLLSLLFVLFAISLFPSTAHAQENQLITVYNNEYTVGIRASYDPNNACQFNLCLPGEGYVWEETCSGTSCQKNLSSYWWIDTFFGQGIQWDWQMGISGLAPEFDLSGSVCSLWIYDEDFDMALEFNPLVGHLEYENEYISIFNGLDFMRITRNDSDCDYDVYQKGGPITP